MKFVLLHHFRCLSLRQYNLLRRSLNQVSDFVLVLTLICYVM